MDEASFGDRGACALAGQVHEGGERGLDEASIVGVGEVVHEDAGGAHGNADFVCEGQAAADDQLAHSVGVPGGVVPLVPSFLRDVRRGEPIRRKGVDTEAPVIFNGPRAEILGQAEDGAERGAVLLLLAEECTGRVLVRECGRVVGLEARPDGRAERQCGESGPDVGAVRKGIWG